MRLNERIMKTQTGVRILNNQEKPLHGGVGSQKEPSSIPKNTLEGASQRAVSTGRNRNEVKLKDAWKRRVLSCQSAGTEHIPAILGCIPWAGRRPETTQITILHGASESFSVAKDKNPLHISEMKHFSVWVWWGMLRQSRNLSRSKETFWKTRMHF